MGVRAAVATRWFWVLGAVEEAPSALAVLLMAKEMAGIFPCNDRRRSRGMVLGGGKSTSSAFESLSSESVNEEGGICGGGGGTTGKTTDKDVPVPSRKLIRRGIVIGDCHVFSCLTCTFLFNRSLGIDFHFGFVRQFAFLATFNRILLLSTGHSRERCSGGRNG